MTTYLVTGGAGFIGSHLADRLTERGDAVIALDNLATGSLANIRHLESRSNFRFEHGSVLDELVVDELAHESDVIVHLAAAVGVKLIVEQPLRSLTTNIRGSEVVLDAAHRYRCKTLVASTSEVYGKNPAVPLAETADRVLGASTVARWAYSTAKSVDEILAFAYHKERGLPTVVVRMFNTVGPRQSAAYGMVIPRLVRQAIADQPLTVYGDGTQTRCFCHVQDVVSAIVALLDRGDTAGEVYNIGSQHEISMLELARRIVTRSGSRSDVRLIPYEEAYEWGFEDMMRRVPDTGKLNRLIGWKPTRGLDEILDEIISEARAEGEISITDEIATMGVAVAPVTE
jgi:nucleoside-diphosphate-sugar epimerase